MACSCNRSNCAGENCQCKDCKGGKHGNSIKRIDLAESHRIADTNHKLITESFGLNSDVAAQMIMKAGFDVFSDDEYDEEGNRLMNTEKLKRVLESDLLRAKMKAYYKKNALIKEAHEADARDFKKKVGNYDLPREDKKLLVQTHGFLNFLKTVVFGSFGTKVVETLWAGMPDSLKFVVGGICLVAVIHLGKSIGKL